MAAIALIQKFILASIGLACILGHSVDSVTYYVRPHNGSCNVSGTVLNLCYPLYEYNKTMLSKRDEVKVLFLQEYHLIPRPYVFKVINVRRLILKPWNSSQMVEIGCRQQSYFRFKNVISITIRSIKFTSCGPKPTITYLASENSVSLSMKIFSCTFQGNPSNNAISAYNIRAILIRGCIFDSNFGELGGAIYDESDYSDNSIGNLTIVDTIFINNTAEMAGGAICLQSMKANTKRSLFFSNAAGIKGGAIYHEGSSLSCADSVFARNSAAESGGAIYHYSDHASYLTGNNTFVNNEAKSGKGGVIYCENWKLYQPCSILFSGTGIVDNNTAIYGGFSHTSQCILNFDGVFSFTNNKALEGGLMYFERFSVLYFVNGAFNVSNNAAQISGGALFLSDSSRIDISFVNVIFKNNIVTSSDGKGGAIYFLDGSYDCETITLSPQLRSCSISYLDFFESPESKPLVFQNNSANQGSVIYGGLFDRCTSTTNFAPTDDSTGTYRIDQIAEYEYTPLAITSDSVKLCLCSSHNRPHCGSRVVNETKMRGELISINIAAVDQNETAVQSVIRASYSEVGAQLDKGESTREIKNRCSELRYHIYTAETSATLILKSDGPCINSQLSLLILNIDVVPCAQGFEQSEDRCICDRRLTDITNCNIDTQSVQRKGNIWLRYDEMYLKINQHCPLDFCQVTNSSISIMLPDQQCANHRSGVLCGSCQQNFSMELGGSKCARCDGKSLYTFIWLLAVFIGAGAALVVLLLTCKLTTSVGDINGLIFYANIISVSGLMNLSKCSIHPILYVFISWINLDFGIETCFYSGMDTYQKTWLQFVFPLYIWLLVMAIIIASYYSSTAMRIFGRNNIAILATLFLLSYTKILKTITTALTFSEVLRGKANDVTDALVPYTVWTYDGNVEYLKGKHITLFVVTLMFLVLLFLPYTLVLTVGQFLRSMRARRGLRWVKSIAFVSIMDAYHAPYHRRHRYWTGFMLLTRCVLFITFATNFKESALLSNMYAINVVIIAILTIKANISDVYKNPLIEKLELSFLLNLAILAATVYYLEGRREEQCECLTASVSISFAIFVAILVYHAYLQLKTTERYRLLCGYFLTRWQVRKGKLTRKETAVGNHETETGNVSKFPTTSVLQLREPLLESVENDLP